MFRAEIKVPRGAELLYAINRLPGDQPDQPLLLKQGREIMDGAMIVRSRHHYW